MGPTRSSRRAAAVLAALAIGASAALTGGPAAYSAPASAPAMTTVTFKVAGCEGCKIRVYQVLDTDSSVYQSRSVTIEDGGATLQVPSDRTHGMSASVRAPWEGATGYVTQVAFRYGLEAPGTKVTLADATTKKKASGCWAGSDEGSVKLRLKVKRVTVDGVAGPTPGTIAYAVVTQDFYRPMEKAYAGVLGSQDVLVCDEP